MKTKFECSMCGGEFTLPKGSEMPEVKDGETIVCETCMASISALMGAISGGGSKAEMLH